MYTIKQITPSKWENDWLVTADLRGLETFDNCESNYDIVERLKANKVLNKRTREDSEYCQFFAHFSSKKSAEAFIRRLGDYVEKRKKILSSL